MLGISLQQVVKQLAANPLSLAVDPHADSEEVHTIVSLVAQAGVSQLTD